MTDDTEHHFNRRLEVEARLTNLQAKDKQAPALDGPEGFKHARK